MATLSLVAALGPAAWAQEKPDGPAAPPSGGEAAKAVPAPGADSLIPENPAVVPATRPGAWARQHESFLERGRSGEVGVLFLGDSITAGWRGSPATWDRYYGPRKAANFGIGGDRTQHVLWRLDHGEVDAIKPAAVVLMIGTNNIGHDSDSQVAEGVAAVVGRLRAKLPDAKILLLGILPKAPNRDPALRSIESNPRVARINARLAALDDGRTVRFLDIGAHFLDESGQIHRDVMPDFVHLSPKGYRIWADAIEPRLWEMTAGAP